MEALKTTLLLTIEGLDQKERIKTNLKKYCNWLIMEKKKDLKNVDDFYNVKKLLEETTEKNYQDFKERFKKIDKYITFKKFGKMEKNKQKNYLEESIKESFKKDVINIIDNITNLLNNTIEELKAITIRTEWKKSQTWGNCPRSDVFINNRLVGSVYSSGCGYCKLSTNYSNGLNKSMIFKSAILKKILNDKNFNLNNKDWLPYGLHVEKYGIYAHFGGYGRGTSKNIIEYCGLKVTELEGKTWDYLEAVTC